MSREIRKVPKDWKHPTRWTIDVKTRDYVERGVPLYGRSFEDAAQEWDRQHALWIAGEHPDQADIGTTERDFEQWDGSRPQACDYMPDWPDEERTHFMLYETTSEGTPCSPAFETIEELCAYAAEHCTTFASYTATAEEWRKMLDVGFVHHREGNMVFL